MKLATVTAVHVLQLADAALLRHSELIVRLGILPSISLIIEINRVLPHGFPGD